MDRRWFRYLSDQDNKEDLKQELKYTRVLKILREILKEEYENTVKDRRSLKSVLEHNYIAHQADRNATERTYLKVLDLIDMENKDG